ncbi:hypothetical protein Hanom_Chr01g00021991 [Helianthus anomalus]
MFVNVHGDVHKSISRILREHHDGAWLTFKQVPRDEVARMYDRFRVTYLLYIYISLAYLLSLHFNLYFYFCRLAGGPSNEQAIYEGFLNMLKKRFGEIMM